MCGIAGELNWSVHANREAVGMLVSGIAHRGPDDRGLWSSPGGACALGHARLSIVDLSPAGHQPMVDPLTGNAVVFNGEIYNFQSLRKDCQAAGDRFTSRTDTEVILALYRRHGIDCLKFLRGMFALAIWDERAGRLFLARDRVGKKPLNYAVTKTGISFCSELHPLSRHPGVDAGMDPTALELFLSSQFIPAPWTIYRGIRKLPAAHYAVFDRGGLRIEKYWEVDYRDKLRIGETAAIDALEEKLTEAVRLRMIADVPLGALLSGGVDSSVTVALMAKLSKEPVHTFSIGFDDETFNELPWARQAAERCGTMHHSEIVHGDVEHLLPQLARHYGEPFADTAAVPSFFVSAAARRHVTVALNGDGGDELLGGYDRYAIAGSAMRTANFFGGLMRPALLTKLAPLLRSARSIPMRAVRKAVLQYTNPELNSVLMFSEYWQDALLRELMPTASSDVLTDRRREALERAHARADNSVDRMLSMDNGAYLSDCLLVKMDIAAMHCGLETRSPLLDHEVIEFCARLPARYKVNGGVGKYLLKKLAERHFPADFVHRRKMGFGIPLASWLRGPLRKALHETLRDPQVMAPLAAPVIERTLREFESGGDEHASRLWALLMFGCWRKLQLEDHSKGPAASVISCHSPPAAPAASVLMFCPLFRPSVGGAQRQAEKLSASLVKAGCRVRVLTPRLDPDSPDIEEADGVTIERFPLGDLSLRYPIRGVAVLNIPYILWQIARAVRPRLKGVDILHCHLASLETVAAALAGRIARVPTICKAATADQRSDLGAIEATGSTGFMVAWLARFAIQTWVATTAAVEEALIRAGVEPERIARIPNGVELPEKQDAGKTGGRVRRFLYLGRISSNSQRDFTTLIRAFDAAAAAHTDLELAIVGGGDLLAEMKRLAGACAARDRIHLPGFEHPEKWLAWADCFVLPSRREGLSNALLEAMAAGLPCIANDIPPNREALGDGEAGMLVPVGDLAALEKAMRVVVEDGGFAARLAQNAKDRVERHYSIQTVASEYRKLYESLRPREKGSPS